MYTDIKHFAGIFNKDKLLEKGWKNSAQACPTFYTSLMVRSDGLKLTEADDDM